MSNIAKKSIVLALNQCMQAVGFRTVQKAIKSMCGGLPGQTEPALAIAFDYPVTDDGKLRLDAPIITRFVEWDAWIRLPVRAGDDVIHSTSGPIRVPTVIVEQNYTGMPLVGATLSNRSVMERDGFRCQYTGEVLPVVELDIDHVIPRRQGGRTLWTNVVTCSRRVNRQKGGRTPREAGLRLIRRPVAPARIPMCVAIRRALHPTWTPFLVARIAA